MLTGTKMEGKRIVDFEEFMSRLERILREQKMGNIKPDEQGNRVYVTENTYSLGFCKVNKSLRLWDRYPLVNGDAYPDEYLNQRKGNLVRLETNYGVGEKFAPDGFKERKIVYSPEKFTEHNGESTMIYGIKDIKGD
jgi:hypothetical protein